MNSQTLELNNNIRIVLVNPSHPGNIGAAARAMKTMGLTKLYLVNPRQFPDVKATARATQAVDILAQAVVVDTVEKALQDCKLVLGTSARVRTLVWPTLNARAAAECAVQEAQQHPVAILFGHERTGLTNEELQLCHYQVEIPSDPNYSSLNLAAAVQVIVYEIHMAVLGGGEAFYEQHDELATMLELEGFHDHLLQILTASEFLDPKQPKLVISRLRRLFNRARLDKTELNILRGVFTAIQKRF